MRTCAPVPAAVAAQPARGDPRRRRAAITAAVIVMLMPASARADTLTIEARPEGERVTITVAGHLQASQVTISSGAEERSCTGELKTVPVPAGDLHLTLSIPSPARSTVLCAHTTSGAATSIALRGTTETGYGAGPYDQPPPWLIGPVVIGLWALCAYGTYRGVGKVVRVVRRGNASAREPIAWPPPAARPSQPPLPGPTQQ